MPHPRRPRLLAAFVLVAFSAGCVKTWQPSPLSPVETLSTQPARVLLKLADGSKVVFEEPRLEGDVIVSSDGEVALNQVVAIETRQTNVLANVAIYTVFTAATVYFVAWHFWGAELDLPP